MPHITIKMYPGRSEEQKQRLADAISKITSETLPCDESHISVAIKDIEKKDWAKSVFHPEITNDMASIYKKPEYDPSD